MDTHVSALVFGVEQEDITIMRKCIIQGDVKATRINEQCLPPTFVCETQNQSFNMVWDDLYQARVCFTALPSVTVNWVSSTGKSGISS